MPLPLPGGRRNYNPISSTDMEEEEDNTNRTGRNISTNDSGVTNDPGPTYDRGERNNVVDQVSKEGTPLKVQDGSAEKSEKKNRDSSSEFRADSDDDDNDCGERIQIIILDSAQHRFPVDVNPDWSVEKLKREGQKTHKVPPASQRLIFRGKMLADSSILRDSGIDSGGIILHLFPKPRVVVTSSSTASETYACDTSQENTSEHGAHVPQIILDEEEQERRGQILVLGSVEIAEAQNNVKLLSLLLLVVCSMRLLALFSIAMGVAEDPSYNDDAIPSNTTSNHTSDDAFGSGNYEPQVRPWQNSDYFDLIVSCVGFYVATLGMKATTENTFRLATAYFIGTIIAGIGWNLWNVFMYALFVKEESEPKDDDEAIPLTRDDYVTVAFFTVMLPMLVWGTCVARAWDFRRLIEEAELEAAERIRSHLPVSEHINEADDASTSRHMIV